MQRATARAMTEAGSANRNPETGYTAHIEDYANDATVRRLHEAHAGQTSGVQVAQLGGPVLFGHEAPPVGIRPAKSS
jgi:hypothetical protein